jgi:hypothetical protein
MLRLTLRGTGRPQLLAACSFTISASTASCRAYLARGESAADNGSLRRTPRTACEGEPVRILVGLQGGPVHQAVHREVRQ